MFESGRHEEAIKLFTQAVDKDPTIDFYWLEKGAILSGLGRHKIAISCYDLHLNIHPRDTEAWKLKAENCMVAGLVNEALTCCDRALQLNSADISVLLYKGYLLADSFQEYKKAIECYGAALAVSPNDPKIWRLQGAAYHNLDQFKKAINCYNKTLRINRKIGQAWKDKGDSLNCLALEKKALLCYKKAIKLEPGNASFWYITALTHEDLGKNKDAIHAYQQVMKFAIPQDVDLANQAQIALDNIRT